MLVGSRICGILLESGSRRAKKTDLLASTFAKKYVLGVTDDNSYSVLPEPCLGPPLQGVTPELFEKLLGKLNVDSATGPDLLPSRILKALAGALQEPLHWLTKQILLSRTWPKSWRCHWTVPLHKRKAVSDPGNYRGVHLTPHVSKVVERALLVAAEDMIRERKLFGRNQFAYSRGRGCRDAVAFLVLSWISAFEGGRKG